MSCGIYKFENKINHKVYIGQSTYIEKRYREHFYDIYRDDLYHYHTNNYFHSALKKYGKENFDFEILEECSLDELDDRERYWIQYYDSYNTGYNQTLGGESRKRYVWDTDHILDLYHEHKSARKVADIMGCNHNTIDDILKSHGIQLYKQRDRLSKSITITYGDQDYIFNNTKEAADWVISNGLSKSTDKDTISHGLLRSAKYGIRYYDLEVKVNA